MPERFVAIPVQTVVVPATRFLSLNLILNF